MGFDNNDADEYFTMKKYRVLHFFLKQVIAFQLEVRNAYKRVMCMMLQFKSTQLRRG